MATHVHWFFVPHYDGSDTYFTNLKDNFAPPTGTSLFSMIKLIINGGGGTVDSFDGIDTGSDQVYIFGHSNGRELGSKKVKYESGKLLHLLEEHRLPKQQKVFKLFGCTTGVIIKGFDKSLAQQFQELAHSSGRFPNAVVYGYTGYVVLGKADGHRKVYTSLRIEGKKLVPTSEAYRASERRVVFPQGPSTPVHLTTQYELEKGDGWEMVVEKS